MNSAQILTLEQREDFIKGLGGYRREERVFAANMLRAQGRDPVEFLIAELHAAPPVAHWKFSAGSAERNIGAVIRALASCDDLRVIGPLCERMDEADEDSQWRAQLSLKNLLPRLRPADSALLNFAQKTRMYSLLNCPDALLCAAAIQASANVGDSRALPQVQALAHSANIEIRQAALAALTLLRERARREQESQTLLRGSSAPATDGDTLLRPAPPAHPANPAELLRAVSDDLTQNPKSKIQNGETNNDAEHQIRRSQ